MSEQLPPPYPERFPSLARRHVRVLAPETRFGRIHAAEGRHPARWDAFRTYGPAAGRFDPHPPPPGQHPGFGVLYAVPALPAPRRGGPPPDVLGTCLAEVYQDRRAVELGRDAPYFVVFESSAPLRLLDLADSDWLMRAGGNTALMAGPRARAREWARAIHARYAGDGSIDGLLSICSLNPAARTVALWEPARARLAPRPLLHRPLADAALRADVEVAARCWGLPLLP